MGIPRMLPIRKPDFVSMVLIHFAELGEP
jgi:hypothetical protein